MTNPMEPYLRWKKSTASQAGNCVQVAFTDESVLVRDSKDSSGSILSFSSSGWEIFVNGVRYNEFGVH